MGEQCFGGQLDWRDNMVSQKTGVKQIFRRFSRNEGGYLNSDTSVVL